MQSGRSAGVRTLSQELPAASGLPSAGVTMATLDNNWIRFTLLYNSGDIFVICILMLSPKWLLSFFSLRENWVLILLVCFIVASVGV